MIVSIGGTWCPNCMDESVFLADWYKKNKNRGVEVVGIQYEVSTDPEYLQKTIQRFRSKTGIEYTQVIGGLADKQVVVASLPSLNTFLSFPTTIFIDKKGEVVKIHTGFSGPATGVYYEAFVKEFNSVVDSILK
ncbi:MAG: TlpA family protein disulfide reductase [Chitinophagaceae bacterium]|nr:TlpA family protein disulfide reductase [Chitinophagaceae bacterium]